MDKQIALRQEEVPQNNQEAAPQQGVRKIRGQVLDNEDIPLVGADVLVKGTTAGVYTDVDGYYEIEVPDNPEVSLVFNFFGMKPHEELIGSRDRINVILFPDVEMLDAVVVTGYQTISKERTTGAFAKVNSEQFETQRISNVSTMLEGRVAGLTDGQIRGVTSMNGLTTPLYVIDGFPVEKTTNDGYGNWVESVPDINPEDIQSITVLKDAAAASIYGARAANGVVVITTKRAQKDQMNVSFSATLSLQPYSTYADKYLADAATMVELEREWAAQNPNLQGAGAAAYAQGLLDDNTFTTQGIRALLRGYAGQMTQSEVDAQLAALAAMGYSYYDDIKRYGARNPFSQQYNLSFGRGSEKNTFNASITYRNNLESDKYTDNDDIGINIQNTTQITKWLTLDVGTYLNYGSGSTQSFSLFSPGYTYMPYDRLVNGDGSYYTNRQEDRYSAYNMSILNSNGLYNLDITPLDEIKMNLTRQKNFSNRTYARLAIKFTDWLKYTASFQYEYANYATEQLRSKDSYDVRNTVNTYASANGDGTATFNIPYGNIYFTSNNITRAYNFRQQLDFNKTFAGKHEVTALVGTETRENKNNYENRTLYNYDPDLMTYSLIDQVGLSSMGSIWGWGSFTTQNTAYLLELINRYVSFYGNAAYTYDGRYTVTGSIRWDKTNLFSTGSKYQKRPIWSVGASWNIDREEFMQGADWVNMLKLRFSYGIGGNIAKNSAPYMTAYFGSNQHVGGISGTIQSRPNPNLRWEKTATTNVGVDFSLLDNRLSGTVEYYYKNGTDLLANTNGVPTEGWGYSTYTINNGEMVNEGFEISLNGTAVSTSDWRFDIGAIFSYNRNEVTYVNVEAPVSYLLIDYPAAYPRIGNPYNAIYGYQWAGLSAQGTPQLYDRNGELYDDMTPSDIEDLLYFGTTVPVYSGALNLNLRWRNWELAAQFLFEGGHKMRNTSLPFINGSIAPVSNRITDRWQQPGDEAHTDVPRYISSENPLYNYNYYTMYAQSSVNIIDASNLSLNNLSLTYRLPSNACSKLAMKGARIMAAAENLFMVAASPEAKYLLGGYNKPTFILGVYLNF
ncbi:MAG TPA: SusC/RagA family TonB-linked outer membrane protein [Candidatus Coprenecus stercorigallinarum]|nr:SusC/RagA family TonB-linked outer membrane protein [Candidatus Coprenecus stercorigallinarum]